MAALDFPNAPTTGQTFGNWAYDGTAWVLSSGLPSNGIVAYAQIVAAQGAIGASGVNIAGLSVSWIANPARTYRTTVMGCASSTVNSDDLNAFITDGAGTQKQFFLDPHLDSSTSTSFTFSVVETGLSGSITRKVMANRYGSGTMTWYAAANAPSFILVEDITMSGGGGSATPGAWVPITAFLNSWVNYGGGQMDAAWRMDTFDTVRVRGHIKNGIVQGPAFVVPILPSRPHNHPAAAHNSGAVAAFLVHTLAGEVVPYCSSNADFSFEYTYVKAP